MWHFCGVCGRNIHKKGARFWAHREVHRMAKHKRTFLLLSLFCLGLVSCGWSEPTSMGSTLFGPEESYDYPLVDDPMKGRAIYPDEALRELRRIKSHNAEHGVDWFEGRYASVDSILKIEGDTPFDYCIDREYYIPGQYYLHEREVPVLLIQAEGYFMLNEEFFYGVRDLDETRTRYYEPSTIEAMEEHWENNNLRDEHYESFLSLVNEIEQKELESVPYIEDIQCFCREPGDLYINVYHCINMGFGNERRVIARIVYEDYIPTFATIQTIDGIVGDVDYSGYARTVSFENGGVTPREDLDTFFGERMEA